MQTITNTRLPIRDDSAFSFICWFGQSNEKFELIYKIKLSIAYYYISHLKNIYIKNK
jgi:hypothetical protein